MSATWLRMTKNDEYATPLWAVKAIEQYLKRESVIWCPFDKELSNFVSYFYEAGHEVVYSHVDDGFDFFEMETPKDVDYIISNPPYSIKDKIYERLFEIGRPFAMLMNVSGFADSAKRACLFREHGIQVLYLYPRVRYYNKGEALGKPSFQSGYVCKNILPRDLMIHIREG